MAVARLLQQCFSIHIYFKIGSISILYTLKWIHYTVVRWINVTIGECMKYFTQISGISFIHDSGTHRLVPLSAETPLQCLGNLNAISNHVASSLEFRHGAGDRSLAVTE